MKLPQLPKFKFSESNKSRTLLILFEKMLNELVGIIDPTELKLAEQLGSQIYDAVMRRYDEKNFTNEEVRVTFLRFLVKNFFFNF